MAPNTPPPESPRETNGHARTDGPTPNVGAAGLKETFAAAVGHLGEMSEYASYYAAVQTDAVKAKVRWAGVYAALGLVGALIGGTVLIVGTAKLVGGLSGAIGHWTGYLWLGDLIVGFLIVAAVAVGSLIGLKVMKTSFRRKLMEKYEARHQAQRERFGTDILRRSREEGSERL